MGKPRKSLNVDDTAENADWIKTPGNKEAEQRIHDKSVLRLIKTHIPKSVDHICPLCGFEKADSYEGHGGLLVCQKCGKTYDPEVESWQGQE